MSEVEKLISTLEGLKDKNSTLLTTISNLDTLLESLKELDAMIEMYDVKKSIVEQVKFLLVNTVFDEQKNNFEGHMLHTVISAGSGAGKTTVGIILAKIWMSLGLLKKKEVKIEEKETEETDTEDELTDIHLDKIQDLERQIQNLTSGGKFKTNVVKKLQEYTLLLKTHLSKLDKRNIYRLKTLKRELDKLKYINGLSYNKCVSLISDIMKTEHENITQIHHLIQNSIPEENMTFTLSIQKPEIKEKESDPVQELDNILNEIKQKELEDNNTNKDEKKYKDERENKDKAIQTIQTFFQNSINFITSKMVVPEIKKIPDINSNIIRIVSREDFVGQYLGHTANKTLSLLQENIGKVLFIDEAYSLINDEKDSYGHECLSTLNKFMSENGDKIIIIFAGYKDLMEQTIFKAQPGLKRRCTWNFEIKGYSEKGLSQIFIKQLKETGWKVDESINLEIFFRENKEYFPHFGGSCLSLSFYCKIVYGTHVFDKGYENNKIIDQTILNEALTYLKTVKEKEDISYKRMFS